MLHAKEDLPAQSTPKSGTKKQLICDNPKHQKQKQTKNKNKLNS
jgi:hypothetical protein